MNLVKYSRKLLNLFGTLFLVLTISSCSNSDSSLSLDVFESAEIKAVKGGTLQVCPSATIEQMANSFLASPTWRDFDSVSGGKVVELKGGFTYDGMPADALIQFTFEGTNFEAAYLGINGIDQNLLMLSALLNKMCEATL